jgi:hypothetical protein
MMKISRTPFARRALLLFGIPVCLLLTAQAALAAPGSTLWVSRYDGRAHGGDRARAMGVSPDGSMVFVTGNSYNTDGRGHYATVAYDAATGAKVWVSRYDGLAYKTIAPSALGVSPDGSTVFVTGNSRGPNGDDYATVAYSTA